jgi:hypothetical protein
MAAHAFDRRVANRTMRGTTSGGLSSTLAYLALVVAGCAPAPAPRPAPAPAAAPPQAAAPAEHGGAPARFVTGHAVYDITATGLVSDPNDTTGRQDTVVTTTSLAYDTRLEGPLLEASGEIISRVMSTATATSHSDTSRATRTTFRATVDTASGVVTLAPDSAASPAPCGGRDPSTDQARKLATTRPRSFIASATWRDVVNDSSCLGGLPLVSRSAHAYTVAPQSAADPVTGLPAVLISHTSTTTMAGSGHRAGHYITLYGSGTGTTEEYYDRRSGLLLSAHTAASLDLDITLSGHVQHLHQQADWRAKLTARAR